MLRRHLRALDRNRAVLEQGHGQAVFGTAPIDLAAWLAVVPFALTMLIAEEGRKAIVRVSERRGRETARVASVT